MEPLSPIEPKSDASPAPPPMPVLSDGAAYGQTRQVWVGEQNTFPLTLKPGRQKWNDILSEYRTGTVSVSPSGITLSGKATLPNSTKTIVYVVCLLVIRIGFLIAYFVMEYAFRQDRTDNLAWDNVDAVLVEPQTNRVCLIYHLPKAPKTKYALGLQMAGGYYDDFVQAVRAVAPERVMEGKIGAATPVWVWIFLGVIAVAIGIVIALGSRNG